MKATRVDITMDFFTLDRERAGIRRYVWHGKTIAASDQPEECHPSILIGGCGPLYAERVVTFIRALDPEVQIVFTVSDELRNYLGEVQYAAIMARVAEVM